MCWSSVNKPVRLIAENDIKVKKVLNVKGDKLYSPVQNTNEWQPNVVYKTKLQKNPAFIIKQYNLYMGFHSCANLYCDRGFWRNGVNREVLFPFEENDKIFDAIIPKGSEYYVNEDGDYISNQLCIFIEMETTTCA